MEPRIGLAALILCLAGAGAALGADKYTKDQLEARYYYDLGPGEVDVSSYPAAQQQNYLVFKMTCSQCHTLARPINAPLVRRDDWKRFVQRMHLRTESRGGTAVTKGEAKTVVDFLAYDSQRRKAKGKAAFAAEQERLKALFEEVKAERTRRQIEEDKSKVKTLPLDNSGARPSP